MDSQTNNPSLETGEIRFPNDNRALFVKASPDEATADILKALEIKKPATILLLIGGAGDLDPALNTQIERLLEHGLVLAATDTDALIIDGGTKAGVMALMGKVMALRGRVAPLLGIAPQGKVTYPGGRAAGSIDGGVELDPNHSHFILVQGAEWSAGTDLMFRLTAELAKKARVVVVLINGGDEARDEVKRAAKLGWPIVVVQGSGRLADEIAAEVAFASEGNFEVFGLQGEPGALRQSLIKHIEGPLIEAWKRFGQYDSTAQANQERHRRLLSFTLAIGVLGTLFALAQKQFTGLEGRSAAFIVMVVGLFALVPILLMGAVWFLQIFKAFNTRLWWAIAFGTSAIVLVPAQTLGARTFLTYAVLTFQYLAIGVPVIVAILLTASNQFKNRRKWILLRSSAEAIKTEIFRYRTRVGDYADDNKSETLPNEASSNSRRSRDAVLAQKIVEISDRLMRTEVNTGSLLYDGPLPPENTVAKSDDGFSFLTPERYIEVRLEDQLSYYSKNTKKLERQRSELQWLIFIVGGGGTLLAALGAQLWIALTTAAVTALSAWVGDLKLDLTLIKYNQAAAALSNLRVVWNTQSSEDKAQLNSRQDLVNKTEETLENERVVWVQQMEDMKEEDRKAAKGKEGQNESAQSKADV